MANRKYPKIMYGGVEFMPISGIEQCNGCNEYGNVEAIENVGSTYYPFCGCDYGRYARKVSLSEGDVKHVGVVGFEF